MFYEFDALSMGAKIRKKRESQGLTMNELGLMVGKTGRMISRYEKGQTVPAINVIADIANALGTSPLEFLPQWDIESIRLDKAKQAQQQYMEMYDHFYEQAGKDPVRTLNLVKEVHESVKNLMNFEGEK